MLIEVMKIIEERFNTRDKRIQELHTKINELEKHQDNHKNILEKLIEKIF